MSVAAAAGQTYTGAQVSVGNVTDFGAVTQFTETASNNPDTLSIGAVNGSTVQFTYTANGTTLSAFGTVLANTANSFVFSYINGTTALNFYVTNTPQTDIPGINTAAPPDEAFAPVYQAPCYCPGTLIRTERGDVPVELLRAGDTVVTVSGESKAVRWIGTRAYGARFCAGHPDVWPVRFAAGSLGTDAAGGPVPSRTLSVSPRHAMLIDGVLVAAELLVNGTTIRCERPVEDVRYVHVELPAHDAVWAENAASETFTDDGSRGMFHNADTFEAMHPGAAAGSPVFCAPRVEDGPVLDAIRQRLGAMAERRAA